MKEMKKDEFLNINKDLFKEIRETTTIKDNTKTSYINTYYRLSRELKHFDFNDIVQNPEKYANHIDDKYQGESRRKCYISILSLMNKNGTKAENKQLYSKWYDKFLVIKKELTNRFINQVPTEKQQEAHMQWEKIVERVSLMKDKKSQEYLLMCMITMIPPRRQMDWFNVTVHINKSDTWKPDKELIKVNHINLGYKNPYILLSNYKTSKYYGRWYKKIPADLLKVLKNIFPRDKKNITETLFLNPFDGEQFKTVESFTKWTNSVIKEVLDNDKSSMNTLRHSFASYIMRTYPNMSLLKRKTYARDLGHSLVETLSYDVERNMNTFANK